MTTLEDYLGKLKRNEQQMTEEQKIQYAKPLKALKAKILKSANDLLNDFFGSAIGPCGSLDKSTLNANAKAIVDKEIKNGTFKNIVNTLFTTYSIDEFLKSATPIHLRIRYEVYAPYWVEHCKKIDEVYYNDLINAKYIPEFEIWKCDKTREYTIMLPPTMNDVNRKYQKEREELKKNA